MIIPEQEYSCGLSLPPPQAASIAIAVAANVYLIEFFIFFLVDLLNLKWIVRHLTYLKKRINSYIKPTYPQP
jgi:hypothetical protein